jgi:DNA-binding transcriptional regulator YdaS (Cro superfamily)
MSDRDTLCAAIKNAIELAGGPTAVATKLGISPQAVWQWRVCPPLRVIDIERISGVSRHALRPDMYPSAEAVA